MSLDNFLNSKTLFYDKIDYDIIKKSWEILSQYISLPYVIHIVGTNGKGSTGRFLTSFLHQKQFKVLHYSSPHIITFNERIWINGDDVDNVNLEMAHQKLQNILPTKYLDRLTYFEYTTLLALYLSNDLDYLILEAGLGGEFDATNVVMNNLTIVPSIGLDHIEFLGDTIEQIAQTKLRSCDNSYIFGKNISVNVIESTKDILIDKKMVKLNEYNLDEIHLPIYLKNNLSLAFSVLEYLQVGISNLKLPKLFGRFEYYKKNIIIDVGHNPLAAQVIYDELSKNKLKIILIYNSYSNKNYKEVLTILKPIIKEVQIIPIEDKRVVEKEVLENILANLNITYKDFTNDINDDELYVVFGSFLVIEKFLSL